MCAHVVCRALRAFNSQSIGRDSRDCYAGIDLSCAMALTNASALIARFDGPFASAGSVPRIKTFRTSSPLLTEDADWNARRSDGWRRVNITNAVV